MTASKWPFFAALLAVCFVPGLARAQVDPWAARVRARSDTALRGPRHLDLTVVAAVAGALLSFLVRSDDADFLDKGIEKLSLTFVLDTPVDGTTDLYLAMH